MKYFDRNEVRINEKANASEFNTPGRLVICKRGRLRKRNAYDSLVVPKW